MENIDDMDDMFINDDSGDYDEYVFGAYNFEEPDEAYIDSIINNERRKKFEADRNIKRDWHGRLNKGARLAQQDKCDNKKIWLLYSSGLTVKAIVNIMGCGKSTVYNVIKEYKENRERTNLEKLQDVE